MRHKENQNRRVTHVDTLSAIGSSVYEADNCEHCHASYGHKITCPLINRNVAEALSLEQSEADRIYAHALGVAL